jgi:hypothetical protein
MSDSMIQGIEDPDNGESSSESGNGSSEGHEKADLVEYPSDTDGGQVTVQDAPHSSYSEMGSKILQLQTLVEVEDHSASPGSPPAMRKSPTPRLAPLMQHVDASTENPFTVEAPETRAGRKRKARDLHSILVVCTCGEAVSESEISQNRDIIRCRRAGCETGWVSQIIIF